MERTLTLPAIPEVQASQPGAVDSFLVCDLPGLAEAARGLQCYSGGSWSGGRSKAEAADLLANGDLSGVEPSQRYMDAMEGHVFTSRKYRVIDDVVGGVPNVPNYLAGLPQSMRRRIRTTTATAPLSIFVDLTSSGSISAEDVRKRGMAILCLVRLLANLRPVELWAFTGIGSRGKANYTVVRVETAPLDLARAAHVLTCPSVSRGVGYGLACDRFHSAGGWPYGDSCKLQRQHGAAIMARVCEPGSDVLFIPPVYLLDDSVNAPEKWIADKLAEFGGQTVEREEG
jgi:hypothetical protein